ncbi:MAG: hypothetical protein HZA54_16270 [Planctomycetes bacterium]|nr:hypothetical protein [Planctomycetota bacterium]
MPNGTVAGSTTPRRATALVLVAAAALCVLAYANTLSNGFVYDDFEAIVQNPIVHGPLDLGKFLRTPYPCEDIGKTSYRPLTILTYWIDQRIGGGAPWAFHLTNLLWHTLATLAFGALAAGIFGRGRIAATATLLFAVHPVHTEAVAWAVGRAEVISSALGFAALALALARVEGRRRVAAGALGAALFGIALLA